MGLSVLISWRKRIEHTCFHKIFHIHEILIKGPIQQRMNLERNQCTPHISVCQYQSRGKAEIICTLEPGQVWALICTLPTHYNDQVI